MRERRERRETMRLSGGEFRVFKASKNHCKSNYNLLASSHIVLIISLIDNER